MYDKFIRNLEDKVKGHFGQGCIHINSLLTPIKRGEDFWPYVVLGDERLVECDYDACIYQQWSQYQHIAIYHSPTFGNVLFLDGELMLGESDDIYTKTLCCVGEIDYKDKEILILGGGDGGVLQELLKYSPKYVLMAEIDEEVMKACSKYMKSVCGNVLDNLEGTNYKILVKDCMEVLRASLTEGKMYDYVINDLTEYPVEQPKEGKLLPYDFKTSSMIMELSLAVLKSGGKVLARGNCKPSISYHNQFKADLEQLDMEYKEKEVYVPSFLNYYVLYEVWHKA